MVHKHINLSYLQLQYDVPQMLLTLVNVTKTADSQHINLSTDRLEMLCNTISCYGFTHPLAFTAIIAHLIYNE